MVWLPDDEKSLRIRLAVLPAYWRVPDIKESRMMHPACLQIYLRPLVAVAFDLLTSKVDHLMPLPHGPLVRTGIKIGLVVFKILCSRVL